MNMTTTALLEKIKRIQALAENGMNGEKESAQTMLKKLMEKYDISESQLDEEVKEEYEFRFKDDCERRLLLQIFYMVTESNEYWNYNDKKIKKIGVDCTVAQRLEIEACFEFFKKAIRTDLEIFYIAFFSKNNIYPKCNEEKDKDIKLSPKALKALMMMEGMSEHRMLKQIGYGR